MPGDREQLAQLVVPWIDRQVSGARDVLPLLLVWAPRGAGIEDLLADLEHEYDGVTPVATLHGGQLGSLRPHEVARRLVWPLSMRIPGFRPLRFPRFLLGLAVLRGPVQEHPNASPEQLVESIGTAVRSDHAALRRWLSAAAGTAAEIAGAGGHTADFVAQSVDALFQWLVSVRRSAGYRWYGHGLGQPFHDPGQALVQLGRWEFGTEHRKVDLALCRAFLADVRAEYEAARRLHARDHNPVVLIDGAHRPPITGFLDLLLEAGGPAPLTVVAASTVRPPHPSGDPHDWQPAALGEASLTDWELHHGGRPGWERRYPVVLGWDPRPRSDPDERPDPRGSFAHRLAAGHPGAAERVAAIVRDPDSDPGMVFHTRNAGGLPFDEEILQWVMGDGNWAPRRAVLQMALLRDLHPERLAPVLRDLLSAPPDRVLRYVGHDVWVTRPVPGGPLRMHPFARRALAHLLGRRDVGALSWRGWHEQLQAEALTDPADVTTALYHQLAMGEVRSVAAALTSMFRPGRVEEWYGRELLEVVAAPVARPGGAGAATAAERREQLVHAGGGDAPTLVRPRLVAALQLHSDPLGDPLHELCEVIAAELTQLALTDEVGPATAYLVARAGDFRACAQRWRGDGRG
jgi:hypothetical protein